MKRKPTLQSKSWLLALGAFFVLVLACSPSWENHMDLAKSLQSDKRSMEAIAVYEQAIQKFPHHPEIPAVYLKIGTLYYVALQQPQQALTKYRTLIERFPHSPLLRQALVTEVQILEEQEAWAEAITRVNELLKHTPDQIDRVYLQYKIGELYRRRGDLRQAELELNNFIKEYPQSKWSDAALFQLGEVYFHQQKFPEALKYYLSLVKEFPRSDYRSHALYNAALSLEHIGEWDEALEIYEKLLPRHPNPEMLKQQIEKLKKRRWETGRG